MTIQTDLKETAAGQQYHDATRFYLTTISKVKCHGKSVERYRYADENGRTVALNVDPSEPWLWVISEGETALAVSVIEAFVDQGFQQCEYPGGYYEAIDVLEVNV
jgi:hypothetical protein